MFIFLVLIKYVFFGGGFFFSHLPCAEGESEVLWSADKDDGSDTDGADEA